MPVPADEIPDPLLVSGHGRPDRRGKHRGLTVVGFALAGTLLLALSLLLIVFLSSSQSTMPATPAASAPAAAPSYSPPPAPPVPEIASPPLHITFPAAGMDQDVLPLSPTPQESSTGSIVPPPTPDAYWLTQYGTPGHGSTNTTYIVGHSWEGRDSPFNNISTRTKPGDHLTLATATETLTYQVNAITTENKDTLKDSAIWAKVPGRLILITCYTGDLWGTNIIVVASPPPAG